MNNRLPSSNVNLLRAMLGEKIVSVSRQLFVDDFILQDYEENADGPIEFAFGSGLTMHFIAETEAFSVGVVVGKMKRYGESYVQRDVSNNTFWLPRSDKAIVRVDILRAIDGCKDYPSERVLLEFENETHALIEYIGDEENWDTIRISAQTGSQSCVVQSLR